MAYTTPPTFVADTELTAADLNILGDDIVYLKGVTDGVAFSGVKVTRLASTSVADDTNTDVSFTAEVFDIGGWWSSGASVTVPAGAVPSGYTTVALDVSADVRFLANGTGGRAIDFVLNGSVVEGIGVVGLESPDKTAFAYRAIIPAEAGDIVKLQVRQNSGGALSYDVAKLTVIRLAPIS